MRLLFLPTRRSNVPCHCKLDTEAVAQLVIPYAERVELRKSTSDRRNYNDLVWSRVLRMELLNKKLGRSGYSFHHEISTDWVAVSVLYSKMASPCNKIVRDGSNGVLERDEVYPSRSVGLDPGKKNIATLVDEDGKILRYTTPQRNFESKLTRFKAVLSKEKTRRGIERIESSLSTCSWEDKRSWKVPGLSAGKGTSGHTHQGLLQEGVEVQVVL